MGGNKTRDEVRISRVEKLLRIMGAEIRTDGSNHPIIAVYNGKLNYPNAKRTCPIAASTKFKTNIVGWIKGTFGYDKNQVYQMLRAYT